MSSQNQSSSRSRLIGWPLALVLVVGLAVLAWWLFLRAVPSLPSLDQAGKTAAAIARAYREGTLTTRLTNYATEVEGVQRLQVATLETTEVVSQRDAASVLWGQLQLPDVVVRAEVPVTYTYYLDLNDPWTLTWDEQTGVLTVEAPELRWNPPAVDISAMQLDAGGDNPLRDEAAAIERVRSRMTEWLDAQASAHRDLVAATAREQTEEWVRTWLQGQFGGVVDVRVTIEGESQSSDLSKLYVVGDRG